MDFLIKNVALLAHQAYYDLKISLRNPRARFMGFLFPLILLVILNGVFGNGHTRVDGQRVTLEVFYVPGILAMSIVVNAYAGLVISISALRENGVLKRRRAAPVPAAALIAGQAVATLVSTAIAAFSSGNTTFSDTNPDTSPECSYAIFPFVSRTNSPSA